MHYFSSRQEVLQAAFFTKGVIDMDSAYDDMVRRYGTQCGFVEVEMHVTHAEMLEYTGEECEDFHHLCPSCQNWALWHRTGKCSVVFTRDQIIGLMRKEGA